MRVLRQLAVLGFVLGAARCGDSGGEPVTPASLTAVSGQGQSGAQGTVLAQSLVVQVTGSDGNPFLGATVQWAVASGTATVVPTSIPSDSNGRAATTVTLGNTVGPVTITASLAGLPQVVFVVTIVSACQLSTAITIGTGANGTLTSSDCLLGSWYNDFYTFTVGAQQVVRITLSSTQFDAWLELYRGTASFFTALNDDYLPGTSTDARIEAVLAPGDYVILVSSYDQFEVGAYALTTATRSTDVAGCEFLWSTRGVTLAGMIALTDCADSVGPGDVFYSDRLVFALPAGAVFEARMQSASVDPFLYLVDLVRDSLMAFNDDSATGNPTAYLVFVSDTASVYFLDMGTAATNDVGAYALTLSGPAAAVLGTAGPDRAPFASRPTPRVPKAAGPARPPARPPPR